MKIGDKIVISVCSLLVLLSFVFVFLPKTEGKTVVIKQDNKIIYKGSLDVDKTVKTDTNTVTIKDGAVSIEYSSCKNQICVNHKKISDKGESIVCLPNEVLVEIE